MSVDFKAQFQIFKIYNTKCREKRDTTWHIPHIVIRFPWYISCYIAENRLSLVTVRKQYKCVFIHVHTTHILVDFQVIYPWPGGDQNGFGIVTKIWDSAWWVCVTQGFFFTLVGFQLYTLLKKNNLIFYFQDIKRKISNGYKLIK